MLSESAEFFYKCTDFYAPQHERTLRWDDPALGIAWPLQGRAAALDQGPEGQAARRCGLFPVKVLMTGAGGQVASALLKLKPATVELQALRPCGTGHRRSRGGVRMVANVKPDVIINAAAYTAVDKAESEPTWRARVNGEAPGHLAEAAKQQRRTPAAHLHGFRVRRQPVAPL